MDGGIYLFIFCSVDYNKSRGELGSFLHDY